MNEFLIIFAEIRRNVRNEYEVLLKYDFLNMPAKTAYELTNLKFVEPLKKFCSKIDEPEEYIPVFYDVENELFSEQNHNGCILAGAECTSNVGVHNFIDDVCGTTAYFDRKCKVDVVVRVEPINYDAGVFLEVFDNILQ